MRPRRHAVAIAASTLTSSVVFAGVLTAVLGGLPEGLCAWQSGCGAPRVATAPVPAAKPDEAAPASRVDEALRANRVADTNAVMPDAVAASPVVQGRSASEAAPEAPTPAQAAPAVAEPSKPHRHHRHHRRWW